MSDVGTLTLTEFLLERIAEDEAGAWRAHDVECPDLPLYARLGKPQTGPGCDGCEVPARVLAECEAKRRIVREYTHAGDVAELEHEADRMSEAHDFWAQESALEGVIKILATIYADHPDYREEWKP